MSSARRTLSSLGYLESIVILPPETFSVTGTQTNTIAAFIRRYKTGEERVEQTSVVSADIENVGFDSTGRKRPGDQTQELPADMRAVLKETVQKKHLTVIPHVEKGESFVRLPDMLSGMKANSMGSQTIPLGDLLTLATIGRTPSRSSYSEEGLFLVKVGNLSGNGINWEPRDRNFISGIPASRIRQNSALMLRKGDILLTASAHSPVYIAKKVDMIASVPSWIGGEASFVGEIMMLRPNEIADPLVLLAYLRLKTTQAQIQSLIRGQTAHLHVNEMLNLGIPKSILEPPPSIKKLADLIKLELQNTNEAAELSYAKRRAIGEIEGLISR